MLLGRFAVAAQLLCRLALESVSMPRRAYSIQDRLAMLPVKGAPLDGPVTIHWTAHQVPFIEAGTDEDLAAALGLVHAHLRLGQMELMRRLSQGRISEMIGRAGLGIDRLVRTFDIGRATPEILSLMPPETRRWLEAFARGINHVLTHASELSREFAVLNLRHEPWKLEDIVTLARLAAADVNWLVWLRLLRFRDDPDWSRIWYRLQTHDTLSCDTIADEGGSSLSLPLLRSALRTGSNSFVVSAARGAAGGAIIANDPHLFIGLPNPWLLAGIQSPSHHAVGFMIPGLPFVVTGRNDWIAWGGASVHAASSDLVTVPASAETHERIERFAVRGEPAALIRIREAPWGPVVSDLPEFQAYAKGNGDAFALRWMGHRASDEITAMLRVGQAHDWKEFKTALSGYAVPGLQMNFADSSGHIGQLMAVKLPDRAKELPPDLVNAPEDGWDSPVASGDLPTRFDSADGFLVAANARPDPARAVIGFHFSPPDRLQRLTRLLEEQPKLSVADAMRIQRDVHLKSALAERDLIVSWLREGHRQVTGSRQLHNALETWDGNYDAQSAGAWALELVTCHLAQRLVTARRLRIYAATWGMRALVWRDILAAAPEVRMKALNIAMRKAAKDFGRGIRWGERHRLRLAHPFGAVPVFGRRYRFADLPASGASETLMKTAHGLTNRRHFAGYGSVARHISDLSDPDRNYFALLGGQDGWLGSTTFADQVNLWQRGEYIILPLSAETARANSPYHTTLTP